MRTLRKPSHGVVALLVSCSLWGACKKSNGDDAADGSTKMQQQTNVENATATRNKVDLLFMVDNSPSMSAMQAELISKFPTFLQVFDTLAHPTNGATPQYADLHIGVITSDYGAGAISAAASGCEISPGGQKGLLQAVGAAADPSCGPPTGASYIQYAFGATKDTCNLPGGCTPTALGAQFTCAASVGATGCGFEHQLESTYAALTTTDPTNAGFLRSDAILAVVFVTNEDDGSAPPSAMFFDPDQTKVAEYGGYTTYRQTHFGVACGTPAMLTPEAASVGALAMCAAAPDVPGNMLGGEYDVSRYIDFFTTPGTLKMNPSTDIILVAIDPPTSPFETILATLGTGSGKAPSPQYVPCPTLGTSCIVALQHSCQNMEDPAFFGDPAVRLDTVIKAQHLNQTSSICGDDPNATPDYSQALQKVGTLIASALTPSCFSAPIASVTVDGTVQPNCFVEDVVGATQTSLPYCPATPNTFPCWQEQEATQCPKLCDPTSGKLVQPSIVINRNGQDAPAGASVVISCTTIVVSKSDPDAACGGIVDAGASDM